MNVIDNRNTEFSDDLFEEDEFTRFVSFSKRLSDAPTQTGSTLGDSAVDVDLPQSFGKYQLTRVLGKDSIGVTFLARHADSPSEFAVKRISSHYIERVGTEELGKQLHQLRDESMATNAVFIDNMATIFEVGHIDGQYFYSVGYVHGKSLAKIVNSNAVSNRLSASVAKEVSDSIHRLHLAGVFHGDLSPKNIVIDGDSRPHILPCPAALCDAEENKSLACQAPEISDRSDVNVAAEIWSMGAILYNCLVGDPPSKDAAIIPPRKRNPKVARDLDTICMKCLAQQPRHRYADAATLVEDLDRFLEYQPINASPAGLIGKLVKKLSQMG